MFKNVGPVCYRLVFSMIFHLFFETKVTMLFYSFILQLWVKFYWNWRRIEKVIWGGREPVGIVIRVYVLHGQRLRMKCWQAVIGWLSFLSASDLSETRPDEVMFTWLFVFPILFQMSHFLFFSDIKRIGSWAKRVCSYHPHPPLWAHSFILTKPSLFHFLLIHPLPFLPYYFIFVSFNFI